MVSFVVDCIGRQRRVSGSRNPGVPPPSLPPLRPSESLHRLALPFLVPPSVFPLLLLYRPHPASLRRGLACSQPVTLLFHRRSRGWQCQPLLVALVESGARWAGERSGETGRRKSTERQCAKQRKDSDGRRKAPRCTDSGRQCKDGGRQNEAEMGGTGGRQSNGEAQKNYAKANERTVKTGAKPNDAQTQ